MALGKGEGGKNSLLGKLNKLKRRPLGKPKPSMKRKPVKPGPVTRKR